MTDRTLIHLTGPDTIEFLQGLITNDISGTADGLVYSALLTPQGKFIADFFVVRQKGGVLIDVATSHAAPLAQKLTMYRLRSKVEIAQSPLLVSRGTGVAPDGAYPDPRHDALGWRAYGDSDQSDDTDWAALYVEHVIPQTGIELTPDTYILEAGFERLNGIDFRKGCYVGQEIAARMKHKTDLKKGLAKVSIAGSAPIGTPITADGKPAGVLYSQHGGFALAHLRFDRATGEMQADTAQLRRV